MKLKWFNSKGIKDSHVYKYSKIKKLMIDKEIPSIPKLAEQLGWNYSTLYSKLIKKRPWLLDEAREIANFFDCSIEELFYEEEHK